MLTTQEQLFRRRLKVFIIFRIFDQYQVLIAVTWL